MHVYSRLRRAGLLARWLIGGLVAIVAVPVVLAAPAAEAATVPWTIQPTLNPGTFNTLAGVSCPSATVCAAAGFDFNKPSFTELPEIWNGTAFQIPFLVKGDPLRNATDSFLNAVSCPSTTKCEMVGRFTNSSGTTFPLALLWNGKLGKVSVASQPVPVPAGATDAKLTGISCTSTSVCFAVGSYADPAGAHTLAERWDGSHWQIQPSATTIGGFNAVSCSSATSCMAVGEHGSAELAYIWNGSTWVFSLGSNFNGAKSAT